MIEAMEQQIINSLYSKFNKSKEKRKEIDIERVTDSFRSICSSRNSTLSIIDDLKYNNNFEHNLFKLKENLEWIYNWVTEECISSIYIKYNKTLKDKKKEAEYLAEIPEIQLFLKEFKSIVINKTIDKLMIFHNVPKGDN